MPATVSIIILACNKSRYTRLTLARLLQSTWQSVECILLDNGSTDDTPTVFSAFAEQAATRGWQTKILREPENIGAIAGRNHALEVVTGKYVVFMDNDIVIGQRNWLEQLTVRLDADATIGVLGPLILFAAPPHKIQHAGCIVGREGRVTFRGRLAARDDARFTAPAEVQALISACWIMPRRVVALIGDLDMRFHPVQFEDIDYCYRIREAGFRAVVNPTVYVYHYENVTTDGTAGLNYRYLTIKNGRKFKQKWQTITLKENGPEDASMEWVDVPHVAFDDVGELPFDER